MSDYEDRSRMTYDDAVAVINAPNRGVVCHLPSCLQQHIRSGRVVRPGRREKAQAHARAFRSLLRVSAGQQGNLRRHFALGALADPHPDPLSFAQFPDVAAPQGLHMHEHVRGARATGDEAIALGPVEPFDHPVKGGSAGFGHIAGRLVMGCRHGPGGRIVDRDQLGGLPAARPHYGFADHGRPFLNGAKARLAHADLMEQDIVRFLRGGDEAIPFDEIEPFDLPGDPGRAGFPGPGKRIFSDYRMLMQCFLPSRCPGSDWPILRLTTINQ